jgi:hypothetical protein
VSGLFEINITPFKSLLTAGQECLIKRFSLPAFEIAEDEAA